MKKFFLYAADGTNCEAQKIQCLGKTSSQFCVWRVYHRRGLEEKEAAQSPGDKRKFSQSFAAALMRFVPAKLSKTIYL